jgi:hypothetical protein
VLTTLWLLVAGAEEKQTQEVVGLVDLELELVWL